MIGPQGVFERAARASELGRIENHHVEPLAAADQGIQRVEAVRGLEAGVRDGIQFRAGPGDGDRLLAGVDAEYFGSTPSLAAARLKPPV